MATVDWREVLARVEAGGRMSEDEALPVYLEAEDEALAAAARSVRARHGDPEVATYLVDRNVNYTNVCITDCKFCEFYRRPGHAESYVLTRDAVAAKLDELVEVGGTRVLLQGGHHPELRLSWYEELLSWIRVGWPNLQIDAFSPSEIEHIALLEEMSFLEVLQRLEAAGLGGLPGGGGEILDDEIRDRVSPKKIRTAEWFAVMDAAQSLGLYTTASQVIGFGEEPRHRIAALTRTRRHHESALQRHGLGFMAFISWPLKFESRYGEVFAGLKGWKLGASDEEYLRHTAFCRVYLDAIPHFQASWPTMGLEVASRALEHGCDDMGGTMMEENVVSQAGSVHCSVEEDAVRAVITRSGRKARKRDSWYRPVDPVR